MAWVVQLESGVWLADGLGDPPRTLVRENARLFSDRSSAEEALRVARLIWGRLFDNAKVRQ